MAAASRKWKREREEHGNGTSKPSPEQHRESSPVVPAAETDQVTDEPVMSRETCYKFVKEVQVTFKDDAESYGKFLELIRDVQLKQVDYAGVVSRIQKLFRGHTSLILGFNTFLPEDHQITLPSTEVTEPPEVLMKQQGIMFKRKVEALGRSKYKKFCEILALYKKQSNSIDYVYKLAETLFAGHKDLLADFRTFLPTLEGSDSEMPAQEPHQQPALGRRKVTFVHDLSANVRDNEAPGKRSRRAEIASKGKEKMETTNSKEVAGKLKERTSNREQEARTKPTQAPQPARMSARNATRREQVQTAPTNAAAAGSPHPASDQRVSARTAARKQSLLPNEDTNTPPAPSPPLPSIAELQKRLKNLTKCRPDCKACEHVEYPIFDWQAEDPEYYAKGKANRERERQALIARGVPGSFNDS